MLILIDESGGKGVADAPYPDGCQASHPTVTVRCARLGGNEIKRLDLAEPDNRAKVQAVDSNAGLDLVFGIVA